MRRIPFDFFWLFVRRDLNMRYAGSMLGAVWNLIHPLVMIAIYMMIFSSLMTWKNPGAVPGRVDYGTLTYGVHLCAGLIPWLLFSDVIMRSINVLIENGNFLQKVSFPPIVLFVSLLFNGFVIYGIGYLVFLGTLVCMGYGTPAGAVAGLGVMLLLGLTGMGLGAVLACLNVFLRDTGQVVTVLLQVLFWLNPIVYFKEMIPAFDPATDPAKLIWLERVGIWLIELNPFARFIATVQWLVGQGSAGPSPLDGAVLLGFPLICVLGGVWIFRRLLPEVRDCL